MMRCAASLALLALFSAACGGDPIAAPAGAGDAPAGPSGDDTAAGAAPEETSWGPSPGAAGAPAPERAVTDPDATAAAPGAPCAGDCAPAGEVLEVRQLDPRCSTPRLAASSTGTVFVACGMLLPGDNRTQVRLFALDEAGEELWQASYTGPEHDRAHLSAMAVAPGGGVILVGMGDTPPLFTGESWQNHGFVLRYDAAGERTAAHFPELGFRTEVTALAIAGNGDVVVAGDVDEELFVRRYDPSLAPRWTARLRSVGGDSLRAEAVTLDGEDVIVAGHDAGLRDDWRSFAARLGPDGTLAWRSLHEGPGQRDFFWEAAAHPEGFAVLGGWQQLEADGPRHSLVAIDRQGEPLWRFQREEQPWLRGLLVDAEGGIVTLLVGPGAEYPLELQALSSQGEPTWQSPLVGLSGNTPSIVWNHRGELLVAAGRRLEGSDWEAFLARVAY